MNSYPMTSTTFIRREIEAIEAAGAPVMRFAVRSWSSNLIDPLDIEEQGRTHYLLTGNLLQLILAFLQQLVIGPLILFQAIGPSIVLLRLSGGSLIKHIGYILQANYLRQRLKEANITHLHVHFSTNATTVALLSRIMGGPTYSFTVHGPDELVDPAANGIAMKMQNASAIIAITHYCQTQLRLHANQKDWARIHIVPCGLRLEDFPDDVKRSSQVESNTLVCVGRLCPQKGQIHIPGAIAGLRKQFPQLKVVLIGDGESRPDIEREIAKFDVGEFVELLGWASNAQVRAKLHASRALLLPSYAEGLPIVIMEAFALYRPVLTTPVAGIPELVDDTCGWLFTPGDDAALAAAIVEAMTTSATQLATMGSEGRRRVEERHNLTLIAPCLIEIFGRSQSNHSQEIS